MIRSNFEVKWAKIEEESDAIIPTKRDEDAGFDLYPCFKEDYLVIMPKTNKLIPIGIASIFDTSIVGLIEERGSSGINNMAKRAGVIDSGFRGEWKVIINNTGDVPIVIAKNRDKKFDFENYIHWQYRKAIAQVIFHEIPHIEASVVSYSEILKAESERGAGMLGDSGK